MITSCKAVLKRLDYELRHKDANAGKTPIARANAISRIQNLASFVSYVTNFNLIINVDATRCKTSGESHTKS